MITLTDRVGIVTGAARGIGRAIAVEMAARGAHVIANDLDEEPLRQLADEIGATPVAGDVTRVAIGKRLTECALDTHGRVDMLVNNAGVTRDAFLHKMQQSQWDEVQAIHNRALFTCTQPVVQHWFTRDAHDVGGGSIVCMSSTSGLGGNMGQTNYGAAKAGVMGFVLSLAKELRRCRARVNAVIPSAWTRLLSSIPEEVLLKHVGAEGMQVMQAKRPEDVAAVVCFLCSSAAEGVTGQLVRADGDRIGLFSHPRPKVSATTEGGWSAESVAASFEAFALEPLSELGEL